MGKEIRIPHAELSDPQTVTQVNVRKFREQGLDIHKNEVDELVDDHDKNVRVLKIRNPKFLDMGRRG